MTHMHKAEKFTVHINRDPHRDEQGNVLIVRNHHYITFEVAHESANYCTICEMLEASTETGAIQSFSVELPDGPKHKFV